uniref:Uncharacterized protein n=1 Tax=Pseudo-nitzschia australis TaxID=44445 RepID=A0A6U9ZWL1_9STRA|mmetsp:Transcript_24703/g.54197  ORF Transcript_24703/g.54197 Transcript_24703/m.54197 type:complete len:107 (-) Transcript_24703:205-525(-)
MGGWIDGLMYLTTNQRRNQFDFTAFSSIDFVAARLYEFHLARLLVVFIKRENNGNMKWDRYDMGIGSRDILLDVEPLYMQSKSKRHHQKGGKLWQVSFQFYGRMDQ